MTKAKRLPKPLTTVIDLHGRDHAKLRSDPNFVYVGRAQPRVGYKCSIWANPFKVGMAHQKAIKLLKIDLLERSPTFNANQCAAAYFFWVHDQDSLINACHELSGKVLGCWCTNWRPEDGEPSQPCHAVVLAKLANELGDSA